MAARRLTLWDAVLLGVGAMVSGGIFVLSGVAAELAGPGAILAFLIAGVLAMGSALGFAELAPALPRAGGPYDFAREGLGPFHGFVLGFLYLAGYLAASASYALAFGVYLLRLVPAPGGVVGVVGSAVVLLAVLGVLNAVAGDAAHALGNRLTLLKTGALLAFGAAALVLLDPSRLAPALPHGSGPVLAASGFLFLTYLGFDLITTGAEEMANAERDLARALLVSLGLVIVVYLTVTAGVVAHAPPGELGEAGLAAAAAALGGPTAGVAIALVALAATSSAANACIQATSRLVYAMAREGPLPPAAARIHPTRRTPHVAVLLTTLGMIALALVGDIVLLASVAALAVLVVFAGANVSLVVLRDRRPNLLRPFRVPAYPWLPLAAGLVSLLLTLTLPGRAWSMVLVFALGGVVLYRRAHPWSREETLKPLQACGGSVARAVVAAWRRRSPLRARAEALLERFDLRPRERDGNERGDEP